jgi:hypothetical protein
MGNAQEDAVVEAGRGSLSVTIPPRPSERRLLPFCCPDGRATRGDGLPAISDIPAISATSPDKGGVGIQRRPRAAATALERTLRLQSNAEPANDED